MRIVAPKEPWTGPIDLFLAGGISNCPDWQSKALELLSAKDINVANPRRSQGLEKTGPEAAEQIAWEQDALNRARVVLFWFPSESIGPITLLELGIEIGKGAKPLAIGTHLNYERRFDLQEQVTLARPSNRLLPKTIHSSLEATLEEALSLVAWTKAK